MTEQFTFNITKPNYYPQGVLNIGCISLQAFLIPRKQLDEASTVIDELNNNQSWIYCLSNQNIVDINKEKPIAYIGKTDNFFDRMKTHARDKDYWSVTIGFTTSSGLLLSNHVAYLEREFYNLALDRNRWKVKNKSEPSTIRLNIHDSVRVEAYKQEILRVFSIIGWNLFEANITEDDLKEEQQNDLSVELPPGDTVKNAMWKVFDSFGTRPLTNRELIELCEINGWNKNTIRREYPAYKRSKGMPVAEFRFYPIKVNGIGFTSVRAALNEYGIAELSHRIREILKDKKIYEIVSGGIKYRFELDE